MSNAQSIRYLYNELRNPREDITAQQVALTVARTFDVLDLAVPSIFNTTNVVQGGSVTSLWSNITNAQTKTNILFPTAITNTNVFLGLNSWDSYVGTFDSTTGNLLISGQFVITTAANNGSLLALVISPGVSASIVSSKSQLGTTLPLTFNVPTEVARITTIGQLFVGISSSDFFNNSGQIIAQLAVGAASSAANASVFYMTCDTTNSVNRWNSDKSGTGTVLPMTWQMAAGAEKMRLTTIGTLLVGFTTSDIPNILTFGQQIITGSLYLISSATNASYFVFSISGGISQIASAHSGTGTTNRIEFSIDSTVTATITTDKQWIFGSFSTDIAAAVGNVICYATIYAANTTTNTSFLSLNTVNSISANISSSATGSASVLPLIFFMGSVRIAKFTTATTGDFIVGTTNGTTLELQPGSVISQIICGADGTGTLSPLAFLVNNGQAVTITLANALWVGTTNSDFYTANGDIASPHFVGSQSANTNASQLFLTSISTTAQIVSQKSGTGTIQPMQFVMGNSEAMRISTSLKLLVGRTTDDSSAGACQVQSINNFAFSATVGGSSTSLFAVGTSGNAGSIGLSDTAGSNSVTISASSGSGSIKVSGTSHAFIDGETVTTSGGTRTIREGWICAS